MFNSTFCKVFFPVAACVTLITATAPSPAHADDCQTALSGNTGFTNLASGGNTNKQKRVDEWDSEVIQLHTDLPGVLTIEGTGDDSQGALYDDSASGPAPLVDSALIGTNLRQMQVIIPAGDHCIAVTPSSGASGDVLVEASFTDICHLEGMDDHGDSFLCATELTIDEGTEGEIENSETANDVDMFSFELSSADTVAITSTGSTDVIANLYDAEGTLIDTDDNSGPSSNFEIVQSLDAGKYYVQVSGVSSAEGAYEVEVSPVP